MAQVARIKGRLFILALCLVWCAPASAAVAIVSFTPSPASPQAIGKSITWTATATDGHTGPLTFQFNMARPAGQLALVKDFNVGTLSGGVWTARPFLWVPAGIEGAYTVQVVAKDFVSGETASETVTFQVNRLVTGDSPVVEKTANPLVALFSAPACAAGSAMRVAFQATTGGTPASATNWVDCHPPATMTFEVAGMYPGTMYDMFAQTKTGGKITRGSTLVFTTGTLPKTVPFPQFTVLTAATDTTYRVILHTLVTFGPGTVYPDVATDLAGNIIWYYAAADVKPNDTLTRPLPGGNFLTLQNDPAWDPAVTANQFLRQIDLAGNVVRETNMGAIQQQLVALGAVDGGPCMGITEPVVGSACAGAFHHDAIQTLPNGYTAALLDIEKIFPAGTQGDTSGKPVDIIGDMILVLDTNWQIVWYWDVFDPAGGGHGYAQMPVSRTAILLDTCGTGTFGCPPIFLLGSGIAPLAHDWLHANSLYYWPHGGGAGTQPGDIVWSSRNQDSVFKIDYKDGAGDGSILWRMGPPDNRSPGDFTFNNVYSDAWPWFSHQHDVGIENAGKGPLTLFDNGDTRISPAPLGLGGGCGPHDCNSRGMAVTFSERSLTVTPVVSFDLGYYSLAMGSAQLLGNGNYFFENPIVITGGVATGYSLEIAPTPAAPQLGTADVLLNLAAPKHYRGWQMQSLYAPPTT
jgi:hypothetical protein